RIPAGIAIVFRLLAAGAVTVDQIEQAAAPVPARTNGSVPPVKPPREAATPLASLTSPTRTNGRPHAPEPPAHPREAPEPSPPARAEAAALAILALGPASCRWPLGDPQRPDFCFCGHPVVAQPYCEQHRAGAYLPSDVGLTPAGMNGRALLPSCSPRPDLGSSTSQKPRSNRHIFALGGEQTSCDVR